MINGFETETGELNELEQKLVRLFVLGLADKIGEDRAIKSQEMINGIASKTGTTITGARVRKIINHIRITGKVKNLVATSKGYYIERDPAKMAEYVESLEQRAGAIQAVANALKQQNDE